MLRGKLCFYLSNNKNLIFTFFKSRILWQVILYFGNLNGAMKSGLQAEQRGQQGLQVLRVALMGQSRGPLPCFNY